MDIKTWVVNNGVINLSSCERETQCKEIFQTASTGFEPVTPAIVQRSNQMSFKPTTGRTGRFKCVDHSNMSCTTVTEPEFALGCKK